MFWLTGFLGILAIVAPFIFGFNTHQTAMITSLVLGAVLTITSVYEALADDKGRWEYWVAGIMGVLSIAAPFILGFSFLTGAVLTLTIIGLIAVLLSGSKLFFGMPHFR